MGKPKKTLEQFVNEARNAHGTKFDYSLAEYKNNRTPILIICPKHGVFKQRPIDHIRGRFGCPECGKQGCKESNNRRLDTQRFIEKAKDKYGNQYTYGKVEYKDSTTPVIITCPIHGDFKVCPATFLSGHGCSKCSNHYHRSTNEFIQEMNSLYGDKYRYDKTIFTTTRKRVVIGCPIHGDVKCLPKLLLLGLGCPKCGRDRTKKPIYDMGINDMDLAHNTPCYKHWMGMLQRCYSEVWHKRYPTYKECSVCNEWHYLSNFKRWFDENYIEGYHLDKDILVKGNKVYGPDTCAFIPPRINLLLGNNLSRRGKYPIGVYKKKNRFVAAISCDSKDPKSIGYFPTQESAFEAYKTVKEAYIKNVAQDFYKRGEITERVYNALMRYEVKITD